LTQKPPSILAAFGDDSEFDKQSRRRLLAEKMRRECEALRLYEPLPHQVAFHQSTIQTLVMQKGNQVGGTLCGAVEVARALTGQDPHNKYPKTDGIVACLGYGEKHIGKTFYPKLFKAGAFDIIKDLQTGMWRTYRPWPAAEGGDLEREAEKKPAPPLIPQRFIKEIAWEKRSERIFSVVRLTTGWELWAFNSAGDPGQAQGFQCKLYWVDEDLATSGWISEILFRLLKARGYLRWTALPHGKNDEMLKLLDEAEKQNEQAKPTVKVLRVTTYDNKYIGKETLEDTVRTAKALGEDVYRQRIMGDLNLGSMLMYPTFSRRAHDVIASNAHTLDEDQQTLQSNGGKIPSDWTAARILAARMGEPPADWTRYVSIDPGYNICAIEFLAVPPPELGDQIFLYDEAYLHEATSRHFGEAMRLKCHAQSYQSFIFDMHGGHLRSLGSGELPIDKYREALEEHDIRSNSMGYGFRAGMDDRKRREEEMRTILSMQSNGLPKLMIVAGKCPSFVWEMERFRKKMVKQWGKEVPIDEGDRRVNTHAIEAVEQAIALKLEYVKPRKKSIVSDLVDSVMRRRERSKTKRRESRLVLGTGHVSLGPVGANS
jgi:hypothetical protein